MPPRKENGAPSTPNAASARDPNARTARNSTLTSALPSGNAFTRAITESGARNRAKNAAIDDTKIDDERRPGPFAPPLSLSSLRGTSTPPR